MYFLWRRRSSSEQVGLSPPRYIFGSPGGIPGAIVAKMRQAVSGTNVQDFSQIC